MAILTDSKTIFTSDIDYILGERVNLSLISLISAMDYMTALEVVKLLKAVHGVTYKQIGRMLGISHSSLLVANHRGTFDGVVKRAKLEKGIIKLQLHYLGYSPLMYVLKA